jgi:hypothetical protein
VFLRIFSCTKIKTREINILHQWPALFALPGAALAIQFSVDSSRMNNCCCEVEAKLNSFNLNIINVVQLETDNISISPCN